MLNRTHAALASFLMALSIALGAFGAHALKVLLSAERLLVFETAVRYQVYHALAILLLFLISRSLPTLNLKWVARLFFLGIFLFSGSLFCIVIGDLLEINLSKLGMITPLGGLAFIAAWTTLGIKLLSKNKK